MKPPPSPDAVVVVWGAGRPATPPDHRVPHVYGDPAQIAHLFDALGQLVDHEPSSTFADEQVRASAGRLVELLERRCT